jgi:type I restriction enzyme S subunit
MSSRAPIGYVAIMNVDYATNQGCKSLELRDTVPEFLYYSLIFNMPKIKQQGEGTTFAEISKTQLEKVSLLLPKSTNEHKKIADVLQTVDKAIEKTKELVEKHKRISQGLRHDLFTKGIAKNGRPHVEFVVDSELGRIPKEWKRTKLGKLILYHNAGIYKKADLYGSGNNIVGVSDLYYHESIDGQAFRFVRLSPEELTHFTLKEGDLIYGESSLVLEGIARTLHVTSKGEGTAFAWHTRRIVVNKELVDPQFLHYSLDFETARKQILSIATQTALTGITTTDFFSVKLILPLLDEQVRIRDRINSIVKRINGELSYLDKLNRIKTGLMQDLLTGKVRVAA